MLMKEVVPGDQERLAARMMHRDLLSGRSTEPAETAAFQVALEAQRSAAHHPGPHGAVAIAQTRTHAFDLLRAAGAGRTEARQAIREAQREAVAQR